MPPKKEQQKKDINSTGEEEIVHDEFSEDPFDFDAHTLSEVGKQAFIELSARSNAHEDSENIVDRETAHQKTLYEEARATYVSLAADSKASIAEVARAKEAYFTALHVYVLTAERISRRELSAPDGSLSGENAKEHEQFLDTLFKETYWKDARETFEGKDMPGKYLDMKREVLRDADVMGLFGKRVLEAAGAKFEALATALYDSPATTRILGEVGEALSKARETFHEARHTYLNAYYDWRTTKTLQSVHAHEKAVHAYEKARDRVAHEFRKKPKGATEGMTQKEKDEFLQELYMDEEQHVNRIHESTLTEKQRAALKNVRRRMPVFRVALAAIAFASASMPQKTQETGYTPAYEQADTAPRAHAEERWNTDGLWQPQERQEHVAAVEAPQEAPQVIETAIDRTGTIGAFTRLLAEANAQPWFAAWAEELYAQADLEIVDPRNTRRTEEGRRALMADIIAQELNMLIVQPEVISSAKLPKGDIYVNSGGVFLAPADGGVHIALVRRTHEESEGGARTLPQRWHGDYTERKRY